MKNMMKKALSVIIALAIVIVPMTVFAATGDFSEPYTLNEGFANNLFAIVDAGETIYVKAADCNGSTVTFEYVGYTSTGANAYEYTVEYLGKEVMPVENEVFVLQMMQYNDTFSITNTSAESLYFSLTLLEAEKTAAGTESNPEVLEFNSNRGVMMAYGEAVLKYDNNGYFFNVTAPDDGELSVSVGSDAGWMFYVQNKTTEVMSEWHYSDDYEPISQEILKVSAGDLITIYVQTLGDWGEPNPDGTVTAIVTFAGGSKGTFDNPEVLTLAKEGDYLTTTSTANIAANSEEGYYYTLTAPNSGILNIYFESTNGLYYYVNNVTREVYGDMAFLDTNVQGTTLNVSEGDVVEICVATYNPMDWLFPEGQVTVIVSLPVDGGNTGTDPEDPTNPDEPAINYTNTYINLEVGDNTCTPVAGYDYTIYQFVPEEEGKYTFTTSDGVIGILPGSVYFFIAPSEDYVNSTSAVFECNGVGQSAIIAIKADSTVNVTVTKEDLTVEVIEWVVYENQAELSKFTFDSDAADLVYVDFEDDVINTAVLGEDGYYHLDSANGPILYVNLSDEMLPLAEIPGNDKLASVVYDENGNIVEMIDYTAALMEYLSYGASANGGLYYPLTIDLIKMLQDGGESQGWYGEYGWLGASEDAWMFACYYFPGTGTEPVDPVDPTEPTEPTNPVDPTEPTEPTNPVNPEDPTTEPSNPVENPEIPNTDNEVLAWAMAAMVATAVAGSAIVIKKTKRVK